MLALRAEIMGGVSMSTLVPGGPRAPLPRYWQNCTAREREYGDQRVWLDWTNTDSAASMSESEL